MGIYRGESIRHMLNCSKESDYKGLINELEATLHTRGYPRGCFVRLHYDPNLRRQMLEKLYARERRETKKRDGAVIIFKTPYTPLTKKLGIQHEFSKLKCDIQRILGNNVLSDMKAIVACPIDRCLVRDTYRINFPLDVFPSSY